MLPHVPPLLPCLTNRLYACLIGFSVIRGDCINPHIKFTRVSSRASANNLRISICCVRGKNYINVVASCQLSCSCTGSRLTHIWSRCYVSTPHLAQRLHSSEPVNFTILHHSVRAEVVKQRRQQSQTEMSTCTQDGWSCLSARSGLCCAPSDCKPTKGLTRRAAQPR